MGYKKMTLEQSDDDNVQDDNEYVPTRSESFLFGLQDGWGTVPKTIIQLFLGIIITILVLGLVC